MKNLIITITLLLGVMSYGQRERAVITEYTNSAGEKIFLHKNAASTPSGRCQHGANPRFNLTDQYDMQSVNLNGVEILRIDPNLRNANNIDDRIDYRWVSEADRLAFREDITEGRDLLSDPNRYRNRNGSFSINTPCGELTPRAYLEGQSNWIRTDGNRFFFGPRGDVSIVPGTTSTIRFGVIEWTRNSVWEAYARLQQAYALEVWEQDLIARGFTEYTIIALYQWVIPHGSQTIRVGRYRTDRIQIRIGNDTWVREVPAGIEFIDCVLAGGDPRVCDD